MARAGDRVTVADLRVPEELGTRALLEHHAVEPRGVLHVGGHRGQELETYLACGFRRVLFVEANPELHAALEEHLSFWRQWLDVLAQGYGATPPMLESLCCAASDRDGEAAFCLTACDGQSSLLRPAQLEVKGEMAVPTRRLDSLETADFSLLVADVQGAEMQVLRGAENLLKTVDMVVLEVNYVPRYQGGATPEELDQFLSERGFRAVAHGRATPWAAGGNVAYRRG